MSKPEPFEPEETDAREWPTENDKRVWARVLGFDLDELRLRQRLAAARALLAGIVKPPRGP